MANITTNIAGNLFMTEQQLANALAGMAGIDAIEPQEMYTGSYCKICGLILKFTIDEVSIDLSELNSFSCIEIYGNMITNDSDKTIYAYRTGLTDCKLITV